MALRKKDKWWYGESQADIRVEMTRFGEEGECVPTQFADAQCQCGNRLFQLALDEDQGVAVRICSQCHAEHPMADSEDYLDAAELELSVCVCEQDVFEITVGVSLYEESEDVRWLYVGCRCPACGITGCYGDWKNEFNGYRELLDRV